MQHRNTFFSLGLMLLLSHLVQAETNEACMLEKISTATASTSVAEVKAACEQLKEISYEHRVVEATNHEQGSLVDASASDVRNAEESVALRLASENQAETNPFMLSAYKPNYLLFATYNEYRNKQPWRDAYPDVHMDHTEAKYQLSFKARIAKGVLGGELWGAYTQQSWWQIYNSDASSPFRETNYEPEAFVRWQTHNQIFGFKNRMISLGINHESNGRGTLLSRSWNRIMATASLEKGNLVMLTRVWHRISEDEEDDDNPDIVKYMGYGDITLLYKMNSNTFGFTATNNLRSNNKGGLQLDWTFPLTERFRGYVQYYNGYGESLIDYDHNVNRIGIGVLLNDWL